MGEEELERIKSSIKKKDLKWQAAKTSVSMLSPEERKRRLGLLPGKKELELISKSQIENEVKKKTRRRS